VSTTVGDKAENQEKLVSVKQSSSASDAKLIVEPPKPDPGCSSSGLCTYLHSILHMFD